jgi:hypothetical protein
LTASPFRWVKCHSDDASKGNPGPSAYGGMFRDNQVNELGCFATDTGVCDIFLMNLLVQLLLLRLHKGEVEIIFDLSVIPNLLL